MSSGKFYKLYDEIFQEEFSKAHFDVSDIVIPFSRLFRKYESIDIYSGSEKIPFKERDPEYKMILRQEFANTLNVEFKVFRSVIRFPSF